MKRFCALAATAAISITLAGAATPAEIHDAAREGDLETVKALVTAEPEAVGARDDNGMTPLHLASRGVHPEIVRYLVAHGADVTAKDNNQVQALHSLAYRGADELVALMIDRGADVDSTFVGGRTAIHLAVAGGHAAVVEVLISRGAQVDINDAVGNTPLLTVSADGLMEMASLLIEGGADVNHENSRGGTPVTVAQREGHAEIVHLLVANGADHSDLKAPPKLDGPYLGQEPPGTIPALFAPSVISTERDQLNAVFSPDGREFYFTQRTPGGSVIMEMRLGDDGWDPPHPAAFSGGLRDVDHFMTSDGKRMFFCSARPVEAGSEPRDDADIWASERIDGEWAEPEHLGSVVNSEEDDYYPSLTDDGTLVFSSRRPGGLGANDIYLSDFVDGVWTEPVNLGAAVNTPHAEFDPFVAPDGSYIIFSSDRPGCLGLADLYISFANADGSWTDARNMGAEVNSDGQDFTPMLSPDGTYLFFTSTRAGASDLWWVDASVIDRMTPTTPAQWEEDLDAMVSFIETTHPDPFAKLDRRSFERDVEELRSRIPSMSRDEIVVEMLRISTSLGDGHTMLYGGRLTEGWYPIRIEQFEEGFFVTVTTPEMRHLIGEQVLRINDHPAEDVFGRIESVGIRENPYAARYYASLYAMMPTILGGLEFLPENRSLTLDFAGDTAPVTLYPMPFQSDPYLAWFWLHNSIPAVDFRRYSDLADGELSLSFREPETPYWFTHLEDQNLVYFAFNQCQSSEEEAFEVFNQRMWTYIDEHQVEHLVIDLRNNIGGTNDHLKPLLHEIIRHDRINRPGHLFVLISNKTWSAAIHCATMIENHCPVTFVGQPTAAGPNHFADPAFTALPNSGLVLMVSRNYWQTTVPTDDRNAVEPHIVVPRRAVDNFELRDRALEEVLTLISTAENPS